MDYISRIKRIKSEKKITNERLSELTGIPLGTLSKLLAGINDSHCRCARMLLGLSC